METPTTGGECFDDDFRSPREAERDWIVSDEWCEDRINLTLPQYAEGTRRDFLRVSALHDEKTSASGENVI